VCSSDLHIYNWIMRSDLHEYIRGEEDVI